MTDQSDDDDNSAGYGRPPKKHQFKKGQSGCMDGGWRQRRIKQQAKELKERSRAAKKEANLQNLIKRIAYETHEVRTESGPAKLTKYEITLRNILTRAIRPDASDKDINRALKLYSHAKLLDPAPEKGRGGVLVVYDILPKDVWEKCTEGELLPKDPLHGIPGAEGYLTDAPTRGTIPDEDT